MRRRHVRAVHVIGLASLAALAVLTSTCTDDASGPGRPIPARLALAPAFASPHASIVDVDRLRALLFRLGQTSPVIDTVVSVEGDSVDLQLSVTLETLDERFVLALALISTAGDTVFRAGPDTVTPTTGLDTPEPIPVSIRYTGVGADAAEVVIITPEASVFFGDSVLLEAEARDSDGEAIPGTPIAWTSLDPSRAGVPDEAAGWVVGQSERGVARIAATLLTGPADTGRVVVQPVPNELIVLSGSGQTGLPGSPLASPVVVRARAADGLGVRDVSILFSTPDGGTLVPESTTTDPDGDASTTWTLGPGEGTQTLTAQAPAFPGLAATATAEAASTDGERVLWTNESGGAWGDGAHWSTGTPPMSLDTAVIALDGTYTVTLDTDATVDALELGGSMGTQTLALASGTLTVAAAAAIGPQGAVTLESATLAGAGTWTNDGILRALPGETGALVQTRLNSGGTLDAAAGGVLFLEGGGSLGGAFTIEGSITLSGTAPFALLDGLTSTGSGAVILAAADVAVNAGSSVTFENLTFSGGTVTAEGTVEVTAAWSWMGGTMTGGGTTRLAGTAGGIVLGDPSAPPGLAGGHTLEVGGTLLWNAGTIHTGDAARLLVTPAGSLTTTADVAFTADLGGETPTLENEGTLTVATGVFALDAAFVHADGAVLEGAGTLDLDDATYQTLDGDIAPGTTPGVLTLVGDLRQGATSRIVLELDGPTPGAEHDQLVVSPGPNTSGQATLDGAIDLVVGFTPAASDTFRVLTFGARDGTVAEVTGLDLGGGVFLDTAAAAGALDVVVLSPTFAFTQQPTAALPHLVISPAVTVDALDGRGDPFSTFAGDVTIAVGANPGGGTLNGTTTVAASGGSATFADLAFDAPGTGYTLTAAAAGFATAESDLFDIVPGILWAGDSLQQSDGSGVFAARLDGTGRVQVTTEGLTSDGSPRRIDPRWSPDRRRVTYSARPDGTVANQLHVTDIVTGEIAHLTSATDTSTFLPRYNVTGTHLAFACGSGSEFDPQDVCVVTGVDAPLSSLDGIADGAGKVFVTDALNPAGADLPGPGAFAWDPTDPDRLAVARDFDVQGVTASQIYFVGFDGTVLDSLGILAAAGADTLRIFELDWSPDGTFLVFSAETQDFDRRIYRIEVSDGTVTQLTSADFGDDDVHPVISPDNTQVLFVRHDFNAEGSTFEYFLVPADGTPAETQISDEVDNFLSPEELRHDWSPDGTQLVLVGTDGENLAIYVVPPTVTPANYITVRDQGLVSNLGRLDIQPSWRP